MSQNHCTKLRAAAILICEPQRIDARHCICLHVWEVLAEQMFGFT